MKSGTDIDVKNKLSKCECKKRPWSLAAAFCTFSSGKEDSTSVNQEKKIKTQSTRKIEF